MNIWIINHYAMPPEYEMRIRTNAMSHYLIKKNYNVKIFSASTIHNTDINLIKDKRKLFVEEQYNDLKFIHIKTSPYKGNGFSRIINMLQFPLRLLKVAKQIEDKPDVIISDLYNVLSLSPYILSKRYDAKFIQEIRDLWPESIVVYKGLSEKNSIIKLMYRFEKWIYKKSDSLIFTMEGGKDYIKNKGWEKEIDYKKIHHINNGLDLIKFNNNKVNNLVKDKDLDSDLFKVIYSGSIRSANNVRKIIDVANLLLSKKDIVFLIYGDGNERVALEKYCYDNNITNVIFKGQISKNNIPYILSKGNLNIMHFKQSSLKKYGSSMNKMFEYLASGRPTLSDCEFGYDIINGYKAGKSIDNASEEELVEEILDFYNMPKDEYNKYCQNALKAAEDFDFKVLTDKLEDIILELIPKEEEHANTTN